MSDDDGVILICFKVEDLGDDHDPESLLDQCDICGSEVWIAPKTLLDIADHHPGVTPVKVCTTCAPGLMETVSAEMANTPQQVRAWGELYRGIIRP